MKNLPKGKTRGIRNHSSYTRNQKEPYRYPFATGKDYTEQKLRKEGKK